jgi:hypothetical protein
MKSRRVKWEKHVELMWEMRNAYKILVLKPKESDLSKNLCIAGDIYHSFFLN